MSTQTFARGDLVTANPDFFSGAVSGVVFKIVKVPNGAREVNYVAKPVNPETNEIIEGARGIRAPGYTMQPHDSGAAAAPGRVVNIPLVPPSAGSVIRVDSTVIRGADKDTLYVVLGDSRKGGVRATQLGGVSARYWPHLPLSVITVVPIEEVLK